MPPIREPTIPPCCLTRARPSPRYRKFPAYRTRRGRDCVASARCPHRPLMTAADESERDADEGADPGEADDLEETAGPGDPDDRSDAGE